MQTRVKTTLYTLLFGMVMEFQIAMLFKHDIKLFFGLVILYTIISLISFKTFPKIIAKAENKKKGFWKAFIIHGLFGLFLYEWIIAKNLPGKYGLFDIISQPAMFTWWATMSAMPFLMQHEASVPYRKKILLVYAVYAILSTGLTVVFMGTQAVIAPIIFLQPPFFFYFYRFYIPFAKSLEK